MSYIIHFLRLGIGMYKFIYLPMNFILIFLFTYVFTYQLSRSGVTKSLLGMIFVRKIYLVGT